MRMCEVLEVSTSGYYSWRKRAVNPRAQANQGLLEQIRDVHAESKMTYGSPRVHARLVQRGVACGRHRVARLMRIDAGREEPRGARRLPPGRTCWPRTSERRGRTRSGLRTSLTSTRARAGCTWPLFWTCSAGESSGGRWLITWRAAWLEMHCRWRLGADVPAMGCCIIRIKGPNMLVRPTRIAWPRSGHA